LGRALLLNASFEPLCVVSVRRAVVLVLKEKAEVVERTDRELHAERVSVPVPSVLRLVRFVHVPYRSQVPLSRKAVFVRDGHRCQYCDARAENIDHVVPRSRGGEHTWDNVVAACRSCNARKEDRLLTETGLRLRRRPRTPHASLWLVANGGSLRPDWGRYLPALAEVDHREAVPA
jgi:5-methylcytosine-specific restriction endonuclease McrA